MLREVAIEDVIWVGFKIRILDEFFPLFLWNKLTFFWTNLEVFSHDVASWYFCFFRIRVSEISETAEASSFAIYSKPSSFCYLVSPCENVREIFPVVSLGGRTLSCLISVEGNYEFILGAWVHRKHENTHFLSLIKLRKIIAFPLRKATTEMIGKWRHIIIINAGSWARAGQASGRGD